MNESSTDAGPVAIIGGSGFAGSCLAATLAATERRVIAIGRTPRLDSGLSVAFRRADASNAIEIRRALEGASEVVYAASVLSPSEAEHDPMAEFVSGLRPLLVSLEAVRSLGIPAITFISSGGTIYGNVGSGLVTESTPTLPTSAYAISRLASERFIAAAGLRSGLSARILRVSNLYGPGQVTGRQQGLIGEVLMAILEERAITVFGDGGTVRDYLYVGDFADMATRLIGLDASFGTWNVGSGVGHSIAEVISIAESVTGATARIVRRPERPFDVRRIVLDTSRLGERIEMEPVPLIEGMRRTWDHLVESKRRSAF